MPSTDDILIGLASIANGWRTAAIAWHVALGVWLLAVLAGWRPSARVAGYLLVSPFVSVMGAAIVTGNAFNGAAFAAFFLVFVLVASRLSREPVRVGPPRVVIAGTLLVVFGWGYPHFLETERWTPYLYAAPLGILPCPTLSAVMGLTLLFGQLGSRVWSYALATTALVYGAIGAFVLGVALDYVLLVGALLTTVAALNVDFSVDRTSEGGPSCSKLGPFRGALSIVDGEQWLSWSNRRNRRTRFRDPRRRRRST